MGAAVVMAIALFASTTVISMASAQQPGNMTGGELAKKLLTAAAKAKAIKAVINNKDVYVVVCDPNTTDPGTQCKIYNIQPTEEQ